MKFEEYFREHNSIEFSDVENDYYGGMYSDYIADAWDFQQEQIDRKDNLLFKILKYLQSVKNIDGINSSLRVAIASEVDEWAKYNGVETNVMLEEYNK